MINLLTYFLVNFPLPLRLIIFATISIITIVYIIGIPVTISLYFTAYKHAFSESDKKNVSFKIFTFFMIWITSPKHILELIKILLVTFFGKRRT